MLPPRVAANLCCGCTLSYRLAVQACSLVSSVKHAVPENLPLEHLQNLQKLVGHQELTQHLGLGHSQLQQHQLQQNVHY